MLEFFRTFLRNVFRFPYLFSLYVYNDLLKSSKYDKDKSLIKYGYKVYSQFDQDGILNEIFKRLGIEKGCLVDFGVEKGVENNSLNLLINGWKGYWMDGSIKNIKKINKTHNCLIQNGMLKIKNAFITKDNIELLFKELNVPRDLDLLLIDIDGNDYYVWEAIKNYNPKVVGIEYNSTFNAENKWIMNYNPKHIWDKSNYYGASLKSLELLAQKKGYDLVACNITGDDAFFVRKDLVKNHFPYPHTSEYLFESPKSFLLFGTGNKSRFDDFIRS